MKPKALISKIDWKLLREQKEYCINEADNNTEVAHIYDGLINLLDALQDCAVDNKIVSPIEVFGVSDET